MPFGTKPVCSACRTSMSPMWRKDDRGTVMCNSCFLNHFTTTTKEDSCSVLSDTDSIHSGSNSNSGLRFPITFSKHQDLAFTSRDAASNLSSCSNQNVRKSTRIKPAKSKSNSSKSNPGKGKSRRYIFKRTAPIKAHQSVATIVSSDCVFHEGFYYQSGDIVSLVDHDGDIYYAQIQGLLQDQFCEKSAVITWLLPTTASDPQSFDPATYYLGPTEELPRKLEYMEFVCHAPDDYYKPKYVRIPGLHSTQPQTGFIWTNIGPKACKMPSTDAIFGTNLSTTEMMDSTLQPVSIDRHVCT